MTTHKLTFHEQLTHLNNVLIVAGAVFTFFAAVYASHLWEHGCCGIFYFASYFVWTLIPFAILAWINSRQNQLTRQAVAIGIFTLAVIIPGAIAYAFVIVVEQKALSGMGFLLIPFYQFLLAVIAIPVGREKQSLLTQS